MNQDNIQNNQNNQNNQNRPWNKKIFALLLERAQGERSVRQFAEECEISYVQMRKLLMMEQENPPRPKLMRKIADHAFGEVDLADLMFAAGITQQPKKSRVDTADQMMQVNVGIKFRRLSVKESKMVEEYIDYLIWRKKPSEGEEK